MTPSLFAPKTDSRCALYAVGAQTRHAWKGGIKGGFMAVSLFISTPIQHVPVKVLGTVGQVQERLVRAPKVQSPTEKMNSPFKNPSYNTHDARWNSALKAPTKFIGFRETFCSIFTARGAAGMNQIT
jgi:hypothetical protein